jgi:uncharacterized protein (TIRG00374 family)
MATSLARIVGAGEARLGPHALKIAIGLVLAVAFLWLALHTTAPAAAAAAIVQTDMRWLAVAILLYGLDLAVRVLRWRCLLEHLVHLPYGAFARVLVVGYGVNLLLPARLGELFRVEYFKRSHGVARAWGLSSVLIERMLDGATVVACLCAGLLLAERAPDESLLALCIGGAALFAVLLGLLAALAWLARQDGFVGRWALLRKQMAMIGPTLQVFGRGTFVVAIAATLVIYALEAAALAVVLLALGVTPSPALALVLVGAASLSTLLPSAPGFIGTYQLACALALQQFGLDGAIGVAAASLVQVALFGPVAAGSLVILALGAGAYWRSRP